MKLRHSDIRFISYIYVFLPLLIFFSTWLKPFIGLPLCFAIILAIYYCFNDKDNTVIKLDRDKIIRIGFVLALILLIVLTSGIGGSIKQYPDHIYRNSLFKLLIDQKWPVRMTTFDGYDRSMTYYIGFWLPAALIGKYTSYQFALFFLQLWAFIGLALIFYHICFYRKKLSLSYLVVFLIFGGLDALGTLLTGNVYEQIGNRFEWWTAIFNYPSILTNLFWAYNQAIYGWLITMMILNEKDKRNIIFIYSSSLLSCTFPAIGLLPYVIYMFVKYGMKDIFKHISSIQNIIGFVILCVTGLYVATNIAIFSGLENIMNYTAQPTADNIVIQSTAFTSYRFTSHLYAYLWFILLEFGIYFMILYEDKHKDRLYWLTLIVLLIVPLIQIGNFIDFCLRASIPGLLALYLMLIEKIDHDIEKKNYKTLSVIVILLMIASINTYDTLKGVMIPTAEELFSGTYPQMERVDPNYMGNFDNFFGHSDSFFERYFLR